MKRRNILIGGATFAAVIGGITLTNPLSNTQQEKKSVTARDRNVEIQPIGYAVQPTELLLDQDDFNNELLPTKKRETLVNKEIPVLMEGRKGILVNTMHESANNNILLKQSIGVFENKLRAQEHYRTQAETLAKTEKADPYSIRIGDQSTGGVYDIDTNIATTVVRDVNVTWKVEYSNANYSESTQNEEIITTGKNYAKTILNKLQRKTTK